MISVFSLVSQVKDYTPFFWWALTVLCLPFCELFVILVAVNVSIVFVRDQRLELTCSLEHTFYLPFARASKLNFVYGIWFGKSRIVCAIIKQKGALVTLSKHKIWHSIQLIVGIVERCGKGIKMTLRNSTSTTIPTLLRSNGVMNNWVI